MPNLSEDAIRALIDVGTNRQGAIVPVNTLPAPLRELRTEGLIKNYGLTRKGTIARERIVQAVMEAIWDGPHPRCR